MKDKEMSSMILQMKSVVAILAAIALSACVGTGATENTTGSLSQISPTDSAPTQSTNQPESPKPIPSSPPTVAKRTFQTDVLLFAGDGTWAAEVSSLKSILASNGATYQTVSSAQLDSMSIDDIAKFGTLIFPGGSGGTEADSLSSSTHERLRQAVQDRGVSYVGFCAGAFIAQAPAPAPGKDVSYGLGVVDGPVLDYYYLENQGTDVAMTLYKFADGTTADILWYGGPVTPNTGVVARYPDGNPAISEMWSGKGFVILAGGHPTANQSMLSSLGLAPKEGPRLDVAWKMIHAAIEQEPLPTF
jgi:glutamine amidotransferase-like uncharacterized protein